jgi:beta-aspartyl-peptidase (threonine type)
MSNGSDKGGVVIAVGLLLLVLLAVLGAAAYFVVSRQQMAMIMQAERARMAEAEARIIAEEARAQAEAASVKRSATDTKSEGADGDSIRAAVETILRAQEDAWNQGDIDTFMEHYWNSDDLTFSSSGKTTRGWAGTLSQYRERYPTREKMGRLTLGGLEITPIGDSAALVLGQWSLERESEPVSGNFSLVVRKLDDRWLIIHDHTSRKTE